MRHLILILLCSFLQKVSFAQRWLPPGTELTYSEVEFVGGFPKGYKPSPIYMVDTVTVKGKLCTYGAKTPAGPNTGFFQTYQEAGVVYWYRLTVDSFVVLYDFNKNIGDTWIIDGLAGGASSICSREVKVMDKKIVTINGFDLRSITIQFATGSNPFLNTVIEGIGGLNTPFPDLNPCMLVGHVDGEYGYAPLRCVNHPDIGFHDFKIATSCDYSVTSIVENSKTTEIGIAPNPFSNQITLSLKSEEAAEVFVYDILGRKMLNKSIAKGENNINTEDWVSGVYFYKLLKEDGNIYQGKIVKN